MATKEWTIELSGRDHTVKMDHAFFTGGVKLWVDEEQVVGTPKFKISVPGSVQQIPFTVAGTPAFLEIQAGSTRYDFELVINNRQVLEKPRMHQQSKANQVSLESLNGQLKNSSLENPAGLSGEFLGLYERPIKGHEIGLLIGLILETLGIVCFVIRSGLVEPARSSNNYYIDRTAGTIYNLLIMGTAIFLFSGTLLILWCGYKRFISQYPDLLVFSDGFALKYPNKPAPLVYRWSQAERFDAGIVPLRSHNLPFVTGGYIYYARLFLEDKRKFKFNNGYRNISRMIGLLDEMLEEHLVKKAMAQLEARETIKFNLVGRYFLNEEGVGFNRDFFDWREIDGATLQKGKVIVEIRTPEQHGNQNFKAVSLTELQNGLTFLHLIQKLSANYKKGRLLS